MKHSTGYRSGNSNFTVSAVASLTLAGLVYINSIVPRGNGMLDKDDIGTLVQDCSAFEDIKVYSSIYNGSYFLIK